MQYDTDVLVIGAGPAGLGAAIMSARSGMKTMVAEAYGVPGGMAVIAEVQPFMISSHQGSDLDYPVYQEWKKAMNKYLSAAALELRNSDKGYAPRNINKEIAALAAEDLLLAAGVKVLYHHQLVDVEVEKHNIKSVTLHSKSGMEKISARIYIDCTGDGDLAALAGCQFDMGDENGNCQPMTLCFKLGNVHIPHINKDEALNLIDPEWRQQLNEQYNKAVQDGILHCDREDVLLFPFKIQSGNIIHFNTTRVVKHSGINGKELSEAEIEARRQMRELFFWLRKEVKGFENAEILSMGVQIGVRESRRIHGLFTLKKEHFDHAAKFPDAIARSNYHLDIHSPNGSGTYRQRIAAGEYYEIPYRCIVPADCDNLLIGGRPISADMAMHSSLRIMPTAISIGQAAGVAAAMAVSEKSSPRKLDGVSVRQKLKQLGALLTLVLALTGFNLPAAAGNGDLSQHSGRVFITRHGQRAAIKAPDFDPPLTADGRSQAELVAGELAKRKFSGKIYASPYRRTLETASIIARKLNAPLYVAPLVQEYVKHQGKARTLARPLKMLKAEFPLIRTENMADDWLLQGPETPQTVIARIVKQMQLLPAKKAAEDWLFVTHGAVTKGFQLYCIDYRGNVWPKMPMNWNCSLSEYKFIPGGKLQLIQLFDVSFLPEDLITSNERRKKSGVL